jgi:hypothetical protein
MDLNTLEGIKTILTNHVSGYRRLFSVIRRACECQLNLAGGGEVH